MKNLDDHSHSQGTHDHEWQTLVEFAVHDGSVVEPRTTRQVAAGVTVIRVLVRQTSSAPPASASLQAKVRSAQRPPRGWGFFVVRRQSEQSTESDAVMNEVIEVFLYREGERF
jgi:hypothetical protein